jgi:hypothetical protein
MYLGLLLEREWERIPVMYIGMDWTSWNNVALTCDEIEEWMYMPGYDFRLFSHTLLYITLLSLW